MDTKLEYANRAIAVKSAQGCVGENKTRSLNTRNCDVGNDNIKQAVETREIIARMKPDLLSKLKSVATGAA